MSFSVRWDNNVVERCEINDFGVHYSVLKNDEIQWEKFVEFTKGRGGYKLRRAAALEQNYQVSRAGGVPFNSIGNDEKQH